MRPAPISLLVLAVLVTGGLGDAAADEAAPPCWTVTVDPLTTALGFAHVQIERAVSPRLSIYAGPSLRLFDSLLSDDDEDYVGIGVEAGVRWFFANSGADSAPFGWWAGARGVVAALQADTPDGSERAIGGYASALAGYTWRATDWLVLSGGAGVQYLHYRVAGLGPEGPLPALHTAAGVAF